MQSVWQVTQPTMHCAVNDGNVSGKQVETSLSVRAVGCSLQAAQFLGCMAVRVLCMPEQLCAHAACTCVHMQFEHAGLVALPCCHMKFLHHTHLQVCVR